MDISFQMPISVRDKSWVTRKPKSTPKKSLSSDPNSTSSSDPLTQALFESFLAFAPNPSALFHFTMWMFPIEHPSLFAAHQLQFFCCTSGASHMHSCWPFQ